jgi:DNA-binding response OmpR family regulator
VELDTRLSRVTVDGNPVKLTSHEFRLLSYLMHHQGRVVPRTELVEHIYDQDFDRDSNTIEVLDIQIDLTTQKVTRSGTPVDLTPKELKLLIVLASAPHKLFTRSDLLIRSWDMNFDPESNVVDVSVGRLRRKINLDGLKTVIHSRRGLGYSFLEAENEESE